MLVIVDYMFVSYVLLCFLMLQLDLEKPKRITGIITQGAKDFGVVQFVSAFKIAYSDDGQSWSIVKDQVTRTDKVTAMTTSLF